MDGEVAFLDGVLTLGERLCQAKPFAFGAGEICALLARLGGARGLALFASDGVGDALKLLGASGLPADYLRRFPVGQTCVLGHLTGDLREALIDREAVRVDSIADDPWTVSLNSVALQGGFGATFAVPLLFGDEIVGAMHAFYGAPGDPILRKQLVRAGALVSSALARSEARSGTTRFPVEGLRRVRSQEEIETWAHHVHAAASRYGQVYSAVVYALDRPEILSGRYGDGLTHQGVTALLRIVDEECRASDLAGRHGEAGAVVLMPGTDPQGAFNQCERVLGRFGRLSFRTEDARLQLSASAAISFFPENGAASLDAAIRSAQKALGEGLGVSNRRIIAIAPPGSAAR